MILKRKSKNDLASYLHDISDELYHIALGMMHSRDDAEDALSETFIKVFKNYKKIRQPEYTKTWIVRILLNTCKDALAKQERVSEYRDDIEIKTQESDSFDYVHDYINQLSLEYKEIIVLKYINEYTYKEISEILSIPESTLKSRCYQALKQLKVEMEDYDDEQAIQTMA